jgi:tetratricopeptide (TPR) repeat protein
MYEEANEDFKLAFKEFQNDITTKYFIRSNMGINLRLIGKYEESADMLRQAVELQPSRPGAYNNLGLTCIEMGEVNEAIAHFEKAIKFDTSAAIYYNNLGLAFFNNCQYKDAVIQFDTAKKINLEKDVPYEDPTIAFNLANVYLTQKKFFEALESYQEAIMIHDMNPKYWHHKGIVYEAMIKDLEE